MFWRLISGTLKAFSVARASSTRRGHSNLVSLAKASTSDLEEPELTATKTAGLPANSLRS
jgi:hypothetical protein